MFDAAIIPLLMSIIPSSFPSPDNNVLCRIYGSVNGYDIEEGCEIFALRFDTYCSIILIYSSV